MRYKKYFPIVFILFLLLMVYWVSRKNTQVQEDVTPDTQTEEISQEKQVLPETNVPVQNVEKYHDKG